MQSVSGSSSDVSVVSEGGAVRAQSSEYPPWVRGSALYCAAESGDVEGVRALLGSVPARELGVAGPDGLTPLGVCLQMLRMRHLETEERRARYIEVGVLLADAMRERDRASLRAHAPCGATYAHLACWADAPQVLVRVVEARRRYRMAGGLTPAHCAAEAGSNGCLVALRRMGHPLDDQDVRRQRPRDYARGAARFFFE